MKFTGWYGPKVLYFGDHVFSDLMVNIKMTILPFQGPGSIDNWGEGGGIISIVVID